LPQHNNVCLSQLLRESIAEEKEKMLNFRLGKARSKETRIYRKQKEKTFKNVPLYSPSDGDGKFPILTNNKG
jgi:hypothetical protein